MMRQWIKKLIRWICTSFFKRTMKSAGKDLKINFPCYFTKKTVVGNNCSFNGIKITGNGNVAIGDNFHSGKECLIITSNHNYDTGTKIPYDESYIDGDVIIEDNVWVGSRVIILGGTHIGEGAIIQAGSVVVGDIPKLSIAGGHPAKPFKVRDEEHYYSLKEAKMFH